MPTSVSDQVFFSGPSLLPFYRHQLEVRGQDTKEAVRGQVNEMLQLATSRRGSALAKLRSTAKGFVVAQQMRRRRSTAEGAKGSSANLSPSAPIPSEQMSPSMVPLQPDASDSVLIALDQTTAPLPAAAIPTIAVAEVNLVAPDPIPFDTESSGDEWEQQGVGIGPLDSADTAWGSPSSGVMAPVMNGMRRSTSRGGGAPDTTDSLMLRDIQPQELENKAAAVSTRGRSNSVLSSSVLQIIADDFPEVEEEEESATFSFGDFAVNAEDEASSTFDYKEESINNDAEKFLFGDFVVPAVESSRTQRKTQNQKKKSFQRELIARVVSVTPMVGHNARVKCIATRDGLIASCSALEDYVTMRSRGHTVQMYQGHEDIITSICFSFTGKNLATTSKDQTCRVWDIETARCSGIFPHPKAVTACSFSQNGKYLVTGCQDSGCRLWATRNAKQNIPVPVVSYFGHNSVITSIDFQMFGDAIISGSTDKTAQLWGAGSGNTLMTLAQDSTVLNVRFSPDGKIAFAVTIHKVNVIDVAAHVVKCALNIASVAMAKKGPSTSDNAYFIYVAAMPSSMPEHFAVSLSDGSVRVFRCDAQAVKSGQGDNAGQPTEVVSFHFREKVLCLSPAFSAVVPTNATAKMKGVKDNTQSVVCGDLYGNLYQLKFAVQRY